jgi:hypothetical protein
MQELVWHGKWLFRCVVALNGCLGVFMAQELVVQVCYSRETGNVLLNVFKKCIT